MNPLGFIVAASQVSVYLVLIAQIVGDRRVNVGQFERWKSLVNLFRCVALLVSSEQITRA